MHTHWAANKNTADSANASRKHRAPRSDAASTPAIGRAQTPPQRGHARHSLRNRENSDIKRAQISDVERARILDPGPALMRWDACRGWQAFPRASDACDRDGSLLLLKSIARPKGTRQVESVTAGDVGRHAPPQRNRQMRRARSRSSLARGKAVLRVDWFSGAIPRPAHVAFRICTEVASPGKTLCARTAHRKELSTDGTLRARRRPDAYKLGVTRGERTATMAETLSRLKAQFIDTAIDPDSGREKFEAFRSHLVQSILDGKDDKFSQIVEGNVYRDFLRGETVITVSLIVRDPVSKSVRQADRLISDSASAVGINVVDDDTPRSEDKYNLEQDGISLVPA